MRFFAAEGNNGISLCGQANTACIFAGIREKQVKIRSGMPLRILMWGVFSVILKRNIKILFLLSYFCMTKSTKSHLRGLSSLLKNTFRVHELVAGSSAWQVRAAKDKAKIGGFALRAISSIPRVRT